MQDFNSLPYLYTFKRIFITIEHFQSYSLQNINKIIKNIRQKTKNVDFHLKYSVNLLINLKGIESLVDLYLTV